MIWEHCLLSIGAITVILFLLIMNIPEGGYRDDEIHPIYNPINEMNITCLVTCVNYSDFLSHALLFNKKHFNRTIVITKHEDLDTQRVCKYHYVECLTTEAFGESFNKAAAINFGISHIKNPEWIVHMDADICLPPLFREIIQKVKLDPSCIYGIDRLMVPDSQSWFNFISNPQPQHEDNIFVHTKPFEIGTRIAKFEHGGWIPIGYFQLWNPSISHVTKYPEEHESAARTDMLFALQWPREKRMLLPEIIGYHLATEDYTKSGQMGINWKKRVTQPFMVLTEEDKQMKNIAALDGFPMDFP